MEFPQPLESGVLIQRYKRFFADVAMDDGRAVTAHCPNTGPMLGLNRPGSRVWLSRSDSPTRKLAHTLEFVEQDGARVGVNTHRTNKLVAEALAARTLPELAAWSSARAEVRYGAASRVDFLLEGDGPPCWLEVKSVTLSRTPGLAEFPDCRTERGAKHLAELAAMVDEGHAAAVLFAVQRSDCDRFTAARDLDLAFAEALDRAKAKGVRVLAYGCDISDRAVTLSRRLSIP